MTYTKLIETDTNSLWIIAARIIEEIADREGETQEEIADKLKTLTQVLTNQTQ